MDYLKIVGMILVIVILSTCGAIFGMIIGAVILPIKILEGNVKVPNINEILTKDPNEDQI